MRKLEGKENGWKENDKQENADSFLHGTRDHTQRFYKSFQNIYRRKFLEIFDRNLIGEKGKWTNKGNYKQEETILSYPVQLLIPNVCTTFENILYIDTGPKTEVWSGARR